MTGGEIAGSCIVTITTKIELWFCEQPSFSAPMGLVTVHTALDGWCVGDLLVELPLLVTSQTKISLALPQHPGVTGTVWIVTARTVVDAEVLVLGTDAQVRTAMAVQTEIWLILL